MSGVWIGLLSLAVVVLGFLYLNRKIDRRLETSAIVEKIRQEVDSILIELNSTTERNIALVEQRIKDLGKLIDQADRKVGVLQREMDKQARSADIYSNVVRKRQDELRRAEAQQPEKAEVQKEENPRETRGNLREKVRVLRDQGYEASAIAAKLGSTVGEIELVLSLLEEKR
jgi:hypothetical protein